MTNTSIDTNKDIPKCRNTDGNTNPPSEAPMTQIAIKLK